MESADTAIDALREQANRLYWTSADTVDEAAEQLGISRHALYAAVRPTPVGRSCVRCGERLVYNNRTHRAAYLATCSGCGAEERLEAGAAPDDEMEGAEAEAALLFSDEIEPGPARSSGLRGALGAVSPQRVAMTVGALTLGALLGVVAVRGARHYA